MEKLNYDALGQTASSNNQGIQLEKNNRIEDAIKVYEDNIKLEYPATHSYERLMILYRKRKEYDKEIKVIERAIDVFTRENMRRANCAIRDYPPMIYKIKEALETCKDVRVNYMGKPCVVFCPYNVRKYKLRLIKATKLNNNIK